MGTKWRRVPVPSPSGHDALNDLAIVSAHELWAVGEQGTDRSYTLTEHWNGARWRVVPSPNPPTTNGGGASLSSVTLIPKGGGVWAVGGFYSEQAPSEALIERYGVPFCSDGVDNDHDGAADYPDDPGCASSDAGSEIGTKQCDDGRDNDGDGKIDYRINGTGDPECSSPGDDSELLPVIPWPLPADDAGRPVLRILGGSTGAP